MLRILFCATKMNVARVDNTKTKAYCDCAKCFLAITYVDLHVTCVAVLPSLRPHGLAPRDKHLRGAGRGSFEFENMMMCGCGDYRCFCALTHLTFVLARARPLTKFPATMDPRRHPPTNPQRVPSHKDNFPHVARSQQQRFHCSDVCRSKHDYINIRVRTVTR